MKNPSFICTNCNEIFPFDRVHPRCDRCGEPLEVPSVEKGSIRQGDALNQTVFERYAEFLPFSPEDQVISLHEGFTPLIESSGIAAELGLQRVFLKDETRNPTWSFKDRGTAAGVMHALGLGYRRIGTVSSGNMAASVAAYGARANLDVCILVDSRIPPEKLNPIAVYNPDLVRVAGDYGRLYFESLKVGRRQGIYFINSDVPLRVEGSKTIAFEICEQMNFEVPDYVVIPTSAGGNLRGILKGFEEFQHCGLIGRVPKIISAQAVGCSPIYHAFVSGEDRVTPFPDPGTIAHAIENPFPPSGNEVLRKVRRQNGIVTAVTDEEILQAQKRLAEEGLFGQPAAAVPLAAVRKLCCEGIMGKDATAACIVTGGGLKYTAALERLDFAIRDCRLQDLDGCIQRS